MNYVDKYGRWHVKPVSEENPLPTNNAYIYSFYAQMVGLPVNFSDEVLEKCEEVNNKVLTRHPNGYHIPISHDEYVGICGMNRRWASNTVYFGEKNYFQYCDLEGFTPTPFRKLDIHSVLEGFEGLANEENPRRAVVKYPSIWNIAFWHKPEHQYFYYRCAERSPGITRTIWFIIASLFTIFRKEPTTVMLGFKLMKLMKKPNLTDRFVNFCMNKWGDFKGQSIKYFPEDHPILEKLL